MTRLIALATLGHIGLLGGAFLFQFAGYAPCPMCLWQRWPHAVAILFGVLALSSVAPRAMAALAALAALTTSGIGAFHTGVEQGWWPGPSFCSGGGALSGMTGADLLSTDIADRVVMCTDIVWSLFGLSMAGWNAVLSFGLALIWLAAAQRTA